jgi:hypothetical protein
LTNAHRVVIAGGKIGLQILLDVVARAHLGEHSENIVRERLPLDGLGQPDIVGPPHLIKAHEGVGPADDLKSSVRVENRLQTHPRENPGVVEDPKRIDAVGG